MFPIILILFYAISTNSQNPMPTKDSICENPIFDAALVVSGFNHQNIPEYKRYLFIGEYVLPYLRNENEPTINWTDIRYITNVFQGVKQITARRNGLEMTFEMKDYIYMKFKNLPEIYYLDKYTFKYKSYHSKWQDLGHEFIRWSVQLISDSGQQSYKTYTYFDSYAEEGTYTSLAKKKFKTYFGEFEFEYLNWSGYAFKVDVISTLFPLVFMYKDMRIPTQFDFYYTTKTMETIFFRGDSACVSLRWSSARWHESDYCRSFVDTRTIIGCNSMASSSYDTIPEADPNEPINDIEPNV